MLKESKEKTAFYTPNGKKHWTRMPMGILNAHAFFTAMVADMKNEWNGSHEENSKEMLAKICDLYNQMQTKQDVLASILTTTNQDQADNNENTPSTDPSTQTPKTTASTPRDDVPPVNPKFDFTIQNN